MGFAIAVPIADLVTRRANARPVKVMGKMMGLRSGHLKKLRE
jgi:hypothetical protein